MFSNSPFLKQNPRQISKCLSTMLNAKCFITAHLESENQSFITALISVDEKNQVLIVDSSPDELFNQKLVESSSLLFTSQYQGISVAFKGTLIRRIQYQGRKVFSMPFPSGILWEERREFYRVRLPVTKPAYCLVSSWRPVLCSYALYDLSISGFSIRTDLDNPDIFQDLAIGVCFAESQLILPETNAIRVTFEVCDIIEVNTSKHGAVNKIGCKFTNLSLSSESAIQRFIQKIELEWRPKN